MAVVSSADDIDMFWQFEIVGTDGCLKMVTNPWLPERANNRIVVKRYNEDVPLEITVNADKPLYTYQIDVLGNKISGNHAVDDNEAIQHSIGNVVVMAEWLRQVKEC